ncbi:hypothetical protein KTS45_16945 [Halomicroarcula limicola]|uniref:DUF7344 domain-containing protein n=1 Tax=Haloarcula limicola TaxID=1429915 RepID=A0A8J7YC17_9EURY|nr:hypothetical protein [Halomicroarcula limicola]MBV0925891.1 hypothetical protein [Halomicroarcula limicola]
MTPDSSGSTDESCPLPIDERFDLLSSHYRRYTLYSLAHTTLPVSLPRVADVVTELLYDAPADELGERRLAVYTELYHNHVPRLADAAVVTYDQEDDMMGLGPNLSHMEPLLEYALDQEFPRGIETALHEY